MEPEKYYLKDDGKIPNNKLPLLLYRNVFLKTCREGAVWLEKHFSANNWTNSWRNGVYDFHHYHSLTHEVLGVYSGTALLHLGGKKGEKIEVSEGDVLIIPAGVGHKKIESDNFKVVGAYPDGRDYDMNRGQAGERPQADENIASVPIPDADPIFGKDEGLAKIWKKDYDPSPDA